MVDSGHLVDLPVADRDPAVQSPPHTNWGLLCPRPIIPFQPIITAGETPFTMLAGPASAG
jgi:hypothetical protein